LPGIHARLNDFERYAPFDRLGLLRHVNDPHSSLADLLQQFVGTDLRARTLLAELWLGRSRIGGFSAKEASRFRVGAQQSFDPGSQLRVVSADLLQVMCAVFFRGQLNGFVEYSVQIWLFNYHFGPLSVSPLLSAPFVSKLGHNFTKI
jgi:hypothetical protein